MQQGTHEHQMAWAMRSMASASRRISSLPEMQAAMSHRQARYWQKIMVPMRQLSHWVLLMCISSCSIQRVLATLWVKQKNTCRHAAAVSSWAAAAAHAWHC